MANVYVYSAAAGAGTGVDWANAYTTLAAAATAKLAGDVFYVAHDHAETQASLTTITFAGTEGSPNKVYCVNRAGSVPPVSADLRTTATVSTTGASAISLAGTVSVCQGIVFSAGDASSNASINVGNSGGKVWRLLNCALRLGGNNASSRINLANPGGANLAVLENTTVQFANVGQQLLSGSRAIWRNTPSAITGATIPTTLLNYGASGGWWFVEGVDLSASGAGKTLIQAGNGVNYSAIVKDCKLGASVTVSTNATLGFAGAENTIIRCDSGDTNYRTEKYTYTGTLTTETTIVHTGGASDGGTTIAWKIVTTANSVWEFPFECLPITMWNETVGSAITVTVDGIWGGGAVPLNDDIWIDVEYLGTSGFPLASKATSSKADGLVTGSNCAAGSGTWGGSTTKFAMGATFTPQEKGPLTIYVRAAKANSTFYVDPKPVIT